MTLDELYALLGPVPLETVRKLAGVTEEGEDDDEQITSR